MFTNSSVAATQIKPIVPSADRTHRPRYPCRKDHFSSGDGWAPFPNWLAAKIIKACAKPHNRKVAPKVAASPWAGDIALRIKALYINKVGKQHAARNIIVSAANNLHRGISHHNQRMSSRAVPNAANDLHRGFRCLVFVLEVGFLVGSRWYSGFTFFFSVRKMQHSLASK